MGNSWLRSRSKRQRLCLRLREANPAFHLPLGGVAQRQEHSVVSRGAAGSSPVVPAFRRRLRCRLRGGCGVTAASEVVNLAVPVRIRSVAPSPADAEHR